MCQACHFHSSVISCLKCHSSLDIVVSLISVSQQNNPFYVVILETLLDKILKGAIKIVLYLLVRGSYQPNPTPSNPLKNSTTVLHPSKMLFSKRYWIRDSGVQNFKSLSLLYFILCFEPIHTYHHQCQHLYH